MPSLRDLRRRIKGVQNMRKITKAMELVAAGAHAPGPGAGARRAARTATRSPAS